MEKCIYLCLFNEHVEGDALYTHKHTHTDLIAPLVLFEMYLRLRVKCASNANGTDEGDAPNRMRACERAGSWR